MREFRNPIDHLIHGLGGTVVVAKALGLAPSVVSTWRGKGRIPNWREKDLAKLAKRAGVVLPEKAA